MATRPRLVEAVVCGVPFAGRGDAPYDAVPAIVPMAIRYTYPLFFGVGGGPTNTPTGDANSGDRTTRIFLLADPQIMGDFHAAKLGAVGNAHVSTAKALMDE